MRGLLVALILIPNRVEANDFFDLQMDAMGILENHVQLRLPKAMELDAKGESASLDYGTARFSMRALPSDSTKTSLFVWLLRAISKREGSRTNQSSNSGHRDVRARRAHSRRARSDPRRPQAETAETDDRHHRPRAPR